MEGEIRTKLEIFLDRLSKSVRQELSMKEKDALDVEANNTYTPMSKDYTILRAPTPTASGVADTPPTATGSSASAATAPAIFNPTVADNQVAKFGHRVLKKT
eukprot:9946445-Alexandrium_andersonii.AAC.1